MLCSDPVGCRICLSEGWFVIFCTLDQFLRGNPQSSLSCHASWWRIFFFLSRLLPSNITFTCFMTARVAPSQCTSILRSTLYKSIVLLLKKRMNVDSWVKSCCLSIALHISYTTVKIFWSHVGLVCQMNSSGQPAGPPERFLNSPNFVTSQSTKVACTKRSTNVSGRCWHPWWLSSANTRPSTRLIFSVLLGLSSLQWKVSCDVLVKVFLTIQARNVAVFLCW